jgi:hypothetical protein
MQFTLVISNVLFCNLLVFELLVGILKTLICSISAPEVVIIPLIGVLHLSFSPIRKLTNLEPKLFSLIVLYFLYMKIVTILRIYIHFFSRRAMSGAIMFTELLLLSESHELPCSAFHISMCLQ